MKSRFEKICDENFEKARTIYSILTLIYAIILIINLGFILIMGNGFIRPLILIIGIAIQIIIYLGFMVAK